MLSPSSRARDSGLAIGLDLGTSGMKAVAVDASGAVVARAQFGYPTSRSEPGASEQDPADWIAAVLEISGQIRIATDGAPWAVIGLSGMIPTLVTVDASGVPVGAAITWEDSRSEPEGDRLRAAVGAHGLYARTGQWVDGRYLLPMLARLARVEPERVAASTMLLGAKDYLFSWLTGQFATDPSTATGFGCFDLVGNQWSAEISAAAASLAGASLRLPDVRPTSSTAPLARAAADAMGLPEGLPVCLGAADSVLGALGMGIHEHGDIAYVGGTSTIVLGVWDHVVLDEAHRFLVTPMAGPGSWGLEMDLLATGGAFRWLAGILGLADENALVTLAEHSSDNDLPVFLPYVAPGEQGALWDPDLTGVLHGLHVGHTSAHIARALVDGIVIESRRCLLTLEGNGFGRGSLSVSGGSASNPWFCQQLADASGRVVVTADGEETDRSAAGAAAVGALAIGWPEPAPVSAAGQFQPDPERWNRWAQAADRHDDVLAGVRGTR